MEAVTSLEGSDRFLERETVPTEGRSVSRPVGLPQTGLNVNKAGRWIHSLGMGGVSWNGLMNEYPAQVLDPRRDCCPRCEGVITPEMAEYPFDHPVWRVEGGDCRCNPDTVRDDLRDKGLAIAASVLEPGSSFGPRDLSHVLTRYAHPDSWRNWMTWQVVSVGLVTWKVELAPNMIPFFQERLGELSLSPEIPLEELVQYSACVPVGYCECSLRNNTEERESRGGIPCFTIPSPVTFSTLQSSRRLEVNWVNTLLAEDLTSHIGIPPMSRAGLKGAFNALRTSRQDYIVEGETVNCMMVQSGEDIAGDACRVHTKMVTGELRSSGVKTVVIWNATEYAEVMAQVPSRDIFVIELWAWPAVRCLYSRALDGRAPVWTEANVIDILRDWDKGERGVPTLTEAYERMGGSPEVIRSKGISEAVRRCRMSRDIIHRSLAFQDSNRAAFGRACPLLVSRRMAMAATTERFGGCEFGRWHGNPGRGWVLGRKLMLGDGSGEMAPIHKVACARVESGREVASAARVAHDRREPGRPAVEVERSSMLHGQWTLARLGLIEKLRLEGISEGHPDYRGRMGSMLLDRNLFNDLAVREMSQRDPWKPLDISAGGASRPSGAVLRFPPTPDIPVSRPY